MTTRYISLPLLHIARHVGLVTGLELGKVTRGSRTQWTITTHGWLAGRILLDEPLHAPNLNQAGQGLPSAQLFGSPDLAAEFLHRMGLGSLCKAM